MRTARKVAAAAALACVVTATQARGQAAPAGDDGDLYIVNGAGRTVELMVDSNRLGELTAYGVKRLPVRAGGHGLAILVAGHVVSSWQELDVHNLTLNAPGRPSWCVVVRKGEHLSDPLGLELLDPHQCRLFVHNGGGPQQDVAAGER